MLKILVVDDEALVLEGMQMLITNITKDVRIETSSNGMEAFSKIEVFEPDILITDIRMPWMDGLRLCEQVVNKYPHIKTVLISGHKDFQYAKKAIDLSVYYYAIKPIDHEQFADMLKGLFEQIAKDKRKKENQKTNNNLAKQKLLQDLLRGNINSIDAFNSLENLNHTILNKPYRIIIIKLDDHALLNTLNEESVCELSQYITQTIYKNYSEGDKLLLFTENQPWEYTFFAPVSLGSDSIMEIRDTLSVSSTVGISDVYKSIRDIRIAYQSAHLALDTAFFEGHNNIYTHDKEVDYNRIFTHSVIIEQKELIDLIYVFRDSVSNNYDNSISELQDIFKTLEIRSYSREFISGICYQLFVIIANAMVCRGMELMSSYSKNAIIDFQSGSLADKKKFLVDMVDRFLNSSQYFNNQPTGQIINQVKAYLEKNYVDASLNAASDMLKISPVYLSIIFKEKTGCNFKDYLKNIRIQNAKRLLGHTEYKVTDIGYKVGYSDAKYFNRVFKQETGLTPKEFRKSN